MPEMNSDSGPFCTGAHRSRDRKAEGTESSCTVITVNPTNSKTSLSLQTPSVITNLGTHSRESDFLENSIRVENVNFWGNGFGLDLILVCLGGKQKKAKAMFLLLPADFSFCKEKIKL